MTIAISKSVNFGDTYGSLSTVGYTLLNDDGTTFATRSTSGVYEAVSGKGIYAKKDISISDTFKGMIVWDTGDASPVYAVDNIDYRSYAATSGGGGQLIGGGGTMIVTGQWDKADKEKLFLDLEAIILLLNDLVSRNNDSVVESIKSVEDFILKLRNQVIVSASDIKESSKRLIESIKIDPPATVDLSEIDKKINTIGDGVSALIEYNEVNQTLMEVNSHVDEIS